MLARAAHGKASPSHMAVSRRAQQKLQRDWRWALRRSGDVHSSGSTSADPWLESEQIWIARSQILQRRVGQSSASLLLHRGCVAAVGSVFVQDAEHPEAQDHAVACPGSASQLVVEHQPTCVWQNQPTSAGDLIRRNCHSSHRTAGSHQNPCSRSFAPH